MKRRWWLALGLTIFAVAGAAGLRARCSARYPLMITEGTPLSELVNLYGEPSVQRLLTPEDIGSFHRQDRATLRRDASASPLVLSEWTHSCAGLTNERMKVVTKTVDGRVIVFTVTRTYW